LSFKSAPQPLVISMYKLSFILNDPVQSQVNLQQKYHIFKQRRISLQTVLQMGKFPLTLLMTSLIFYAQALAGPMGEHPLPIADNFLGVSLETFKKISLCLAFFPEFSLIFFILLIFSKVRTFPIFNFIFGVGKSFLSLLFFSPIPFSIFSTALFTTFFPSGFLVKEGGGWSVMVIRSGVGLGVEGHLPLILKFSFSTW
jgi:hypothetical protein